MKRPRRLFGAQLHAIIPVLIVAVLFAAACGGGAEPAGQPAAEEGATPAQTQGGRVVPTMPAARFAQPTTMIDPTKVAEREPAPAVEEADVEFGRQIYTRLCAECHGDALEGVAGEAEPIETYELDRAALTDLLRTGGGFGPEHLFGLDKVSPEGISALQAYLESLIAGE